MQRNRLSFKEGNLPFKHDMLTLRETTENKQQTCNDSVYKCKRFYLKIATKLIELTNVLNKFVNFLLAKEFFVGFLTICFMTRECVSGLFHCISLVWWHSKQARPMRFKRVFVRFPRKEVTGTFSWMRTAIE